MAQNGGGTCDRIPYYSTPEQLYNGQVIGDAATADNVRTVRQSAPLAATFRAPVRLADLDGTTAGGPTWHRPECPDPSELASCVPSAATAVPWSSTAFEAGSAGRYYVRSTAGFDGVLLLYEGAFDPGSPLAGLVGYAEPDATAPAQRRLLLPADLSAGATYALVTTGLTNGDAGAFANDIFGPAGGGIVVAAEGAPGIGEFLLGAATPNPTAGGSSIAFVAAEAGVVRVEVLDVLGRRVALARDREVAAGERTSLAIPTTLLRPGTYAVRVSSATWTEVRRVTVAR